MPWRRYSWVRFSGIRASSKTLAGSAPTSGPGCLIDRQHHRASGRLSYRAADVIDLLDKHRIGRKLKRVGPVGLEIKRPPDPTARRRPQARALGHLRSRPVRRMPGRALQRLDHHLLDPLRRDQRRAPRPRSSDNPSNRSSQNRWRHLPTVGADSPHAAATSELASWSAREAEGAAAIQAADTALLSAYCLRIVDYGQRLRATTQIAAATFGGPC